MKAGWKTVGSAKRKTWNSLGFLVLTLSAAKMRSDNLEKSHNSNVLILMNPEDYQNPDGNSFQVSGTVAGQKVSVTVTVTPLEITSITLTKDTVEIEQGAGFEMPNAIFTYENGSTTTLYPQWEDKSSSEIHKPGEKDNEGGKKPSKPTEPSQPAKPQADGKKASSKPHTLASTGANVSIILLVALTALTAGAALRMSTRKH